MTLTPELHQRLRVLAEQLGQAPASVASMAIGQFVAQQERNLGAGAVVAQAFVEKMAPEGLNLLRQLAGDDSPSSTPPRGLGALAAARGNALMGGPVESPPPKGLGVLASAAGNALAGPAVKNALGPRAPAEEKKQLNLLAPKPRKK